MARVQNPNLPVLGLQMAPQQGSNTQYPNYWFDLTPRLVKYSTKAGKQRELGLAEAGTASFTLLDADEALNPSNASSPFNVGGGTQLKLYRPIRFWQMPAFTVGAWNGNLLNATNDQWITVRGFSGGYADSSDFEGGTVGGWATFVGGVGSIANSAVRAHHGTNSGLVTWPTQTGGGFAGTAGVNLPGVPLRVGDTYTLSAWVWITSGPAVTLRIANQTVASTSTTGAWQQIVNTFVMPDVADNDIFIYPNGSTTAGQNIFIDAIQLEYTNTATAYKTSGPTVSPVFTGFIERYPNTWNYAGFQGMCELSCVDALGMIPRVELSSALKQEIITDNPTLWWPFDDAQNSLQGLLNQLGSNQGSWFKQWAEWTVSVTGGSTTVSSAVTVVSENQGPGPDKPGYLLTAPAWLPPNAFPALPDVAAAWAMNFNALGAPANTVGGTAAGFSLEFWFNPQGLSASWNQRIVVTSGTNANHNDSHEFYIDTTNHVVYKYWNAAGTALETITSGVIGSGWHHVAFSTASSGGTITSKLYLDGSLSGSTARAAATVPQRKNFLLGEGWNAGSPGLTAGDPGFEPFDGWFSNLAVYNATTLSAGRIAVHASVGLTGYNGDFTGQRINRILAYAGWGSYTNIPSGVGVQQGQIRGLEGALTSDALKVASDTDQGLLYASQIGLLQYLPQSTIAASSSSLTFGENTAGGEIPYRQGVTEELEPSQIYNYITVSPNALPTNDSTLSDITTSDATSISDYGKRTLQLSIQALDGSLTQLQNMATFLLTQKKDPRPMVSGMQLNMGASAVPSTWRTILGLTLGQRVTWKRRPTAAGITITFDGYIQTIQWEGTPQDGGICTIDIEPVQV